MIRSLLVATLLIISILNVPTLWASDDLINHLKSFNKKVAHTGVLDYTESCSQCDQMKTESVYSPTNKKNIVLTVLTEDRAMEAFMRIKQDEDIPFNFPYEGCFARAHKMALDLDEMGIISGKAIVEGSFYVDVRGIEVGWTYHAASLVLVKKNGKSIPTVIDPAIFDKPVPYDVWKAHLTKKSKSKLSKDYFIRRFGYDTRNIDDYLNDYDEDQLEDMKSTNRNNARLADMLELTKKSKKKGSK